MTRHDTARPSTASLSLLALSLALAAAPASAQSPETAHALDAPLSAPTETPPTTPETPSTPRWRLDFIAPAGGLGGFWAPAASYERSIYTFSFDLRFAVDEGHGVLVRYAYGGNLWGGGHGIELDYLYRLRLVGDDRVGLGLDVMSGLSFATLTHNEVTVPWGAAYGANVSLELDLRLHGFVVSAAIVYRGLVPTDPAANGGPTGLEHALTGTLGLGFGFWG